MKNICFILLLFVSTTCLLQAQPFTSGNTDFVLDPAMQDGCLNEIPSRTAGYSVNGGNIQSVNQDYYSPIVIQGASTISTSSPGLFDLYRTHYEITFGNRCQTLRSSEGLDMSDINSKVSITVSSNIATTIKLYIARNSASEMSSAKTIAVTPEVKTYEVDFNDWYPRNIVNMYGILLTDPNVTLTVYKMKFGTSVFSPEINVQSNTIDYFTNSTYDFSNVVLNANKDVTFTIYNNGPTSLDLPSVTLNGDNAFTFVNNDLPPYLSPYTANDFIIRFNPTSPGLHTSDLTIHSNDTDEAVYTIHLSGNGSNSAMNVIGNSNGSTFSYGNTLTNSNYDKQFTIENTGTTTLSISSIVVSGAAYSLVGSSSTSIGIGSSANFTVRFNPTTASSYTGNVVITDASQSATYQINLSGQGQTVTPEINVKDYSATMDYLSGSYASVNLSSGTGFRLYNIGTAPLTISSISVSGLGFSLSGPQQAVISPGDYTNVIVYFQQNTSGPYEGKLILLTDDSNEQKYIVNLNGVVSGTGTASVQIAQNGNSYYHESTFDFGTVPVGDEKELTFTIYNYGDQKLYPSCMTSGRFFTFGVSAINPGSSATFTIKFWPTAAGAVDGALYIYSNSFYQRIYVVNFTGTGKEKAPEIDISTYQGSSPNGSTYDFGNLVVGNSKDAYFSLQNTGELDLYITSAMVSGYGYQLVNYVPGYVSPGNSISLHVVFNPSSSGTTTGSITINSNDADESIYVINFTGTSEYANPKIVLSQGNQTYAKNSTFDFGSAAVGYSNTILFTVENPGNSPLYLSDIVVSGNAAFSLNGSYNPYVYPQAGYTTFEVKFTPTAAGTVYGTISFESNSYEDSPYTISIVGKGITSGPILSIKENDQQYLSGSAYYYEPTDIGDYNEATFIVLNSGSQPLTIPSIQVTGSEFSTTNNGPYNLNPGISATVVVRYTRSSSAASYGMLTINNNSDESTYTIALRSSDATPVFSTTVVPEWTVYIDAAGMVNLKGVPQGQYQFQLTNLQGIVLANGQFSSANDNNTVLFPSSQATSGLYMLSFLNEKGQRSTAKLVLGN